MPIETSPNLSLPYIQAAQAQKHVTHNEAIRRLDSIVQLTVESRSLTTPPSAPAENARFIVANGASGDWAGHDGDIAIHTGGGYWFIVPATGWQSFVKDESTHAVFTPFSTWETSADQPFQSERVAINTSTDPNNRLSVSADRTLFNHEGAGHQLTLNKATDSETAALLFQTGFSGRAEIGTTGNDDLSVKTSPDGASWVEALRFSSNGLASGEAVMQSPSDTTPGRLMRADYGYGPGNLVGTVSEAAGLPTGAAIQSGSNANGHYTRFADGTQICATELTSQTTSATTWTYPTSFASPPEACVATAISSSPRLATVGGASATTIDVDCYDLNSTRQAEQLYLLAFGRWF